MRRARCSSAAIDGVAGRGSVGRDAAIAGSYTRPQLHTGDEPGDDAQSADRERADREEPKHRRSARREARTTHP